MRDADSLASDRTTYLSIFLSFSSSSSLSATKAARHRFVARINAARSVV